MKKLSFLFLFFLFVAFQAAAQMDVTGKVTNAETGDPIPGVSIVVKNNPTVGTTSDMDGQYELRVSSDAKALEFSFVGMETKVVQIKGRSTINVAMNPAVQEMDEVVVTAIGIKRESKKLGYAVSQVQGDELTKTQTADAMSSLQGKVAGVNISSSSGQPTASTKVILRGYSSVTGNNQPLYVVDGTPILNDINAQADDLNNQVDFGNGANAINPANIESINILKGAAATALYGSRAANGVIMITTKSGADTDKLKVDFTSSASFNEPFRLPQQQSLFGQGWSGDWASNENGSWGPRMNGEMKTWGNVVDNSRLIKPFEAQEGNMRDFYDVGQTYQNNVSISGGNEKSSFRLSYGNLNSDGFIPTDADSYNRHTISVKGRTTGKKISASASVNYIKRDASAVAAGQGGNGATLFQDIMQIPRDFSIVDMADYKNKFYNVDNFYTPYAQNPYFIINENGNSMNDDRVYGNLELNYDILESLNVQWRIGSDVSNNQIKTWNAIADPADNGPRSSMQPVVGSVMEQTNHNREINSDLTLNYNKELSESFTLNALAGWNVNERYMKRETGEVTNLDIPYYYDLSNSSQTPTVGTYTRKRRLYGIYGQADLAYNNYLFLTLTARNDWSSTLPEDNNSFFYPGATLGFVVTDAIPAVKNIADFAKVRASWGKTGNDADPYMINSVVIPSNVWFGFGEFNFPLAGVNAFEISNVIGNKQLQPEITSEYEFGVDLRFFNNRLGVDLAYYNRTTTDQIFTVPLAHSTGYGSQTMNFGEINNEGFEAMLNITPVRSENFSWDINYTFSKNNNEVIELPEGLDKVVINQSYGIEFVAMEGKPLGVYMGHAPMKDPQGRIVVGGDGIPLEATDKEIYGDGQRDFTMGLNNTFKYKDLSMGFAVDWRKGGLMYAYTARINYFVGNATKTMYNEREPFIVPNSVQHIDTDGDGTNDSYVENTTAVERADIGSYWNQSTNSMMSKNHVIDKSFFKLREVTLNYNLPANILKNLPVSNLSVGLYGRNLLIWTPEENNFVDPEISTFGNDLDSEFGEFAGGPTARSYGFNLKVTF